MKYSKILAMTALTFSVATANAAVETTGTIIDGIGKVIKAPMQKLNEDMAAHKQRLLEAKSKGQKSFEDQLAKTKATINTKVDEQGKHLGGKLAIKQKFEPSYLPQKSQRTDSINAELGFYSDITNEFGLQVIPGINITYVRHYDNLIDSLTGDYYWFDSIPWNAERAKNKMAEGEVMRLELYINGNLGLSDEDDGEDSKTSLGLGINRSARMLVDIYRMENNQIRLRSVAVRNNGTINWSAMAAFDGVFNQQSKFVKKLLNRVFKCVPLNMHGEAGFAGEPSFDTFMVDYVIDLNSAEGQQAYNKALSYVKNIRSWEFLRKLGKLMISFDRVKSFNMIRDELKTAVKPLDDQHDHDMDLDSNMRTVSRLFKGNSRTAINNPSVESECFRIWELEQANYNSRTYLTSYDARNRETYTIYESTLLESVAKFVSGYFTRIDTQSMNAAFVANKSFVPTGLTDMLISVTGRDSSFSAKDLKNLKAVAKASLPTEVYNSISWDQITHGETRNLLKYRFDLIFSKNTASAFPEMTFVQHKAELENFVKAWPREILCDAYPGGSCDTEEGTYKLGDDLNSIAFAMLVILNPDSDPVKRLDTFAILRTNKVFQQIGVAYLVKLLEKYSNVPIKDLVTVQFSSNDSENNSVNHVSGDGQISKDYLALEYQLNLINDRSLDMRVERNEKGEFRLVNGLRK